MQRSKMRGVEALKQQIENDEIKKPPKNQTKCKVPQKKGRIKQNGGESVSNQPPSC